MQLIKFLQKTRLYFVAFRCRQGFTSRLSVFTMGRMQASSPIPASSSPPRPWHLAPRHLPLAIFWGGFFYWLNRLPLTAAELWGHAACGQWILANQALPTEDPFSPLVAGMRYFDTAWLSQVVFAAVGQWGGPEALSALFAATVLAAHALLARAFYLRSRQLLATHLGVVLVAAVGSSRLAEAQADMFGMLCLATLLWLLSREPVASSGRAADEGHGGRQRWIAWVGIPALMALWANLHESFLWGLLALAIWFIAAAVESAWRQRTLGGVIGDPLVRQRLALCEVSVVTACLNPYGVSLLLYVAWFADYRQMVDLPGWEPLVLLQPGGRELLVSLLVALVVFRLSRSRLQVAEILLLAAFSVVFGGGVRLAWWYAAVYGLVITPHLADILARWSAAWPQGSRTGGREAGRTWLRLAGGRRLSYTLIALGLGWICLALSPAWLAWTRGQPRPPEQLYGGATPWRLTQYLRENPPQGQVFHPHWWGDWLIWDGPPGLRSFLRTNMHLAPFKVWIDYRIIRETRAGWSDILARYGARIAVLDRRRQTTLHRYLQGSDQWELRYEDDLSVVFGLVEGKPAAEAPLENTEHEGSIDE